MKKLIGESGEGKKVEFTGDELLMMRLLISEMKVIIYLRRSDDYLDDSFIERFEKYERGILDKLKPELLKKLTSEL